MKTEKNFLIAFILNLAFSIFEFIGGLFTGSVAILSDAVHDLGDATGIGFALFLEKKSKKQPDNKYTYGYTRFSVLGSVITNIILLFSSLIVIYNAINRIINPVKINYQGMILFAVIGFVVNLCATLITHKGHSLNQKAVNLHMLEDVLGWAVVLVGAVIMHFTGILVIDPLMSIGVALFILIHAIKNLMVVINLFLEKIPSDIDLEELKKALLTIHGIFDVHHIHLRSIDGKNIDCTMHIVTNVDSGKIKEVVRKMLKEYGICHATLETEEPSDHCHEKDCHVDFHSEGCVHHH